MIATILMVAITVVLAAVLYVLVGGFLDPVGDEAPRVTLGMTECDAEGCDARVTAASPSEVLSLFQVTVFADGLQVIGPVPLEAGVNVTGSGLTFRYTDIGGEGDVTAGDLLRLEGITPGVEYEIILLWHNGDVVSTIDVPS